MILRGNCVITQFIDLYGIWCRFYGIFERYNMYVKSSNYKNQLNLKIFCCDIANISAFNGLLR